MRTNSSHCDPPSHITLHLRFPVIRQGPQVEEFFLPHRSTIQFSFNISHPTLHSTSISNTRPYIHPPITHAWHKVIQTCLILLRSPREHELFSVVLYLCGRKVNYSCLPNEQNYTVQSHQKCYVYLQLHNPSMSDHWMVHFQYDSRMVYFSMTVEWPISVWQ